MDLCVGIARKKITGQQFATLETKEVPEAGKETEKALGHVITSEVKKDTTDEYSQVENIEMGIEEN